MKTDRWMTIKDRIKDGILTGLFRIRSVADHYFIDGLGKTPVIVDLGACNAEFSDVLVEKYPDCRMILIEADPHLARNLAAKFKEKKNVEVFNAAVGGESKDTVKFYISDNRAANSIYRMLAARGGSGGGIREIGVRMITLNDIFTFFTLQKIDLLKMDIEGAEVDLFEKFSRCDFERIAQISVEFHDFLDASLRKKVEGCIKKLEGLGYVFINKEWRGGGRYVNCLFCNTRYLPNNAVLRWPPGRYLADKMACFCVSGMRAG